MQKRAQRLIKKNSLGRKLQPDNLILFMSIQIDWLAPGEEQNSGEELAIEYTLATCWTLDGTKFYSIWCVNDSLCVQF